MKLFFNYYGDFSDFEEDDLDFCAMEFDSNGKHYIIDLDGEINYDFQKDEISGRFKGDVEVLEPSEKISDEELADIILNMDKSTFKYNIFGDDVELSYRKFEAELWFNDQTFEIERFGKQPMKVKDFFDLLRRYPDWDKDIVIENKKTKMLDDIVDIVCDERNGNLIIVKKEN